MKLAVKMSENLHYLITLKPTMSFNKRESETFGHRKSLKLPADDGMQQATETYSLLDKSKHYKLRDSKIRLNSNSCLLVQKNLHRILNKFII